MADNEIPQNTPPKTLTELLKRKVNNNLQINCTTIPVMKAKTTDNKEKNSVKKEYE